MDAIEAQFFAAGWVPVPKMLRFGENPFDNLDCEYNLVVVCGGDGTINEVASALCGSNTALGIIPCGSGNGQDVL